MCGICGKVSLNKKPVAQTQLKKMTEALSHRGPDGEGFYFSPDGQLGLGHRRLAIIDLATGDQPMTNEDKSLWLVFNGEIYNFEEIRKRLVKKGHRFKTKSDTEVIIHAYEEDGEKCLDYFNGMFAFALWDQKKKSLFLARDRLGQKPLFYTQTGQGFLFASEIKSLLTEPSVSREINLDGLSLYLSLGYFLSPLTMIKGIKSLPPASFLIFRQGKIKVSQYWDLDFASKIDRPEVVWLEKFRELLADSVKKRLVADVPLGAFLSGGIDSTSVVALMRQYRASGLKTFSIGFKERTYNELDYARLAALTLQTDHDDLVVKPQIEKILPKLIWANDQPLFDTSCLPMYFLSQLTRKKVTVALSGDGGDEALAGYKTYLVDKLFPFYQKLPFRSWLADLILNYWPTSFGKVSFDYGLKQFVRAENFNREQAHYFWRLLFDQKEKEELLLPEVFDQIEHPEAFFYFRKYFAKAQGKDFLDRAQYVDIKTWLAEDILVKVDRMTMAHSLEARSPFLDYRLMEFLAQCPSGLKLKFFQTKYLLKRAMRGIIPEKIINRPKEGFNAPIPLWLKGKMKDFLAEALSEGKIKKMGFLNGRILEKMKQEYWAGRRDHSLKLWAILNFVLWYEIFIRKRKK